MQELKCDFCGDVFKNVDGCTYCNTVVVKLTTFRDMKCELRPQLKYGNYCKRCIEIIENEIISCLCDGKFVIDPK